MDVTEQLKTIFREFKGDYPNNIIPLPASGSDRKYFRIMYEEKIASSKKEAVSYIGVYNEEVKENDAFICFSKHFAEAHLPVPQLLYTHNDKKIYILNDLGDNTLFTLLIEDGLSEAVINLYHKVVSWLPEFQVKGFENLNLSCCYPRKAFDKQSMMWDLNYFKYYFARLSGVQFDEQALENDFNTLTDFLLQADNNYFMYRDFQSRNIMIHQSEPVFIDYQGGRKGPLQYDLASLLYDAKANLSKEFRKELLDLYIIKLYDVLKASTPDINLDELREEFLKYFDTFVLMRILQALGAYGYRGFYQKKEHFLLSIPYAMKNLKGLFDSGFNLHIPELRKILQFSIDKTYSEVKHPGNLKVRITSFSFKNSIPIDPTGNGGGFVFDCRALPNPGRLEEYKAHTGLEDNVIGYLANYQEVTTFLENVYNLVDAAVKNYMERDFTNLMINFGCTGGRHRSVYCAEKLANHLNQKFGLQIVPEHTEKENW